MKIKIIISSIFLILLIACVQEINIKKEFDNEKLSINDFNETLKNFELSIAKIVNISNYQCVGGHSGGACYVDFTLKGYEEQTFPGIAISETQGGQTNFISGSYNDISEGFTKDKTKELKDKDCVCSILEDNISFICRCNNIIYNVNFIKLEEDFYTSRPNKIIDWELNRIDINNNPYIGKCVKVEFKNYNEIAYLSNVNLREFEWLEIVDCLDY